MLRPSGPLAPRLNASFHFGISRPGMRWTMEHASSDPWREAAARADTSPAAKRWEIAQRGFGDAWYRLGTSRGRTPVAALKSWVDAERSARPGIYGVRSPNAVVWQPFRVGQSGTVGWIDPSAEDDTYAARLRG